MKSIYKKILSIGLLGALFELLPFNFAHAGLIDGFTSGAITVVAQVVLGIFTFFAQGFFIVSGFLIELAMKMNNSILDPAQNVFVFEGWTVFVNVADLALVVALIIIAFATMLNYESYGMKKTLPKLIIVALLVNFSLVIPGVLVDLSGMVTSFFVEQAGLNGSSMSSSLASAFNISSFMSTANMNATAGANQVGLISGKLGFGIMNILMNMVFIVVFTAVATVIMLTLAIMLFLRYFMLSFLLLMSPVIFVAWIFPGTKSHWDKWWNDFIRWTMFPPVMVFFMWLSLTALNATSATQGTTTGSAGDLAQKMMNFNLSALINMAMAVMLMILSLVAANGISIKGAKGGKDMIGTMTKWGQDRITGMQKTGRREAERLGRRGAAAGIAGVGAVGARAGITAAGMRKYEAEKGGLRGMAAGALGRAGGRISKSQQDALKKAYEEKFKGMSEDDLAMRYSTMGRDEKLFAAQQLAKKGKLGKVNEDILDRDIASAETKRQLEGIGGPDAYKDFVKAAGRNKEMVEAKAKQPELNAKIRDVESKIAEVGKSTLPLIERNTKLNELQKQKDDLAAGGYNEIAKKFYDEFSKENFEKLGSDFYKKGRYGEEALASLMRKEPGAFGKIISGLKKGDDAEEFKTRAESVIESMKEEAIDLIKKGGDEDKLREGTQKELLSVMKGMKDFNEAEAKKMELKEQLKWIEEKDARVHAAIGGEKLATSIEQQLKLLVSRKSEVVVNLKGGGEYQKAIRTQDSMRKSISKRLYGESEKEEKKEEEKKPEEKKA